MNKIINTTRIKVPPENRRELFQTIRQLLEPIRGEHGCLAYSCYVDLIDENTAVLIGEWETQGDLVDHLRSTDCAILFGAINVLAAPANVDFKFFSKIGGMESLFALRSRLSPKEIQGHM